MRRIAAICGALAFTASLCASAYADDTVKVYGDRQEASDDRSETAVMETIKIGDDPKLTQTVGGVLDQGLGIRVQRGGSTGRRETVQMRGAEGQQVTVYLGDVRLSPAGGGGVDLSTLPVHCLERIDVIRGPAAAAYGSGSQGGVIRLHPALKRDAPSAASISAGSFGFTGLDACSGFGESNSRTLIGSRLEVGTGDFPYSDANQRSRTRTNNDHQKLGAMLGHHRSVGRSGTLSAVIDTVYGQRGEPGSAEFPSTKARSEDLRASAGVTWSDASWRSGRWRTSATLDTSHRRYHFSDKATAFGGQEARFRLIDSQAGVRSSLSFEGASWHRPRLSLSGRYERADSRSTNEQTHHRRRVASVLDWTLYGGESLRLFGAIRLDAMNGRAPAWVPRLGFLWSPINEVSLRGNMGRTFRDPSFDELYFEGSGISGDPDLRAEDGLGGDLGLRWKRRGSLSLQSDLIGYINTFDRLILFIPLDAYRVQATDRFAARTVGVEASMRANLRSLWFKAGYHWQRSRFDESEAAPLPHRPEHRVVARVGAHLGDLLVHTGLSSQTEVTSDRFGLRTLPDYSLFDAGLRLSTSYGVRLSLDVHNILNQQGHFDSVHRPLPGRSYFLRAEWRPSLPDDQNLKEKRR